MMEGKGKEGEEERREKMGGEKKEELSFCGIERYKPRVLRGPPEKDVSLRK